jgi:hypothetical protein
MDLMEIGWRVWGGCTWLKIGAGGGILWNGDEPSGSGATELVLPPILRTNYPEPTLMLFSYQVTAVILVVIVITGPTVPINTLQQTPELQ